MATLNVSKNGGYITVSAVSVPTGNTISIATPSVSWATKSGTTRINITSNSAAADRSFTLNATATTKSTTSYPRTGTASSAWTVNQPGTGVTQTYNINLDVGSNVTGIRLDFALSTTNDYTGIVVSGSCAANSSGRIFSYSTQDKTKKLYLLIAGGSNTSIYMGNGTGNYWQRWINGTEGTGQPIRINVYTGWQCPGTYLPGGSLSEWSTNQNTSFFFTPPY